ncbi:hypothetical protein HK096_004736, partial [Nowakowskiella sp. JEL0078]
MTDGTPLFTVKFKVHAHEFKGQSSGPVIDEELDITGSSLENFLQDVFNASANTIKREVIYAEAD